MAANDWKEKVKEVLEDVRPALQRDGGDVQIIEITDDGDIERIRRPHAEHRELLAVSADGMRTEKALRVIISALIKQVQRKIIRILI